MSLLQHFDSFPTSLCECRDGVSDGLFDRLVQSGLDPDIANAATDPSQRAHLLEWFTAEVHRCAAFHCATSNTKLRCDVDSNGSCRITKGVAPIATEIPPEWVEKSRTLGTIGVNKCSSPPSALTVRTSGRKTLDESCPFSTPPEFQGFGFGNSPLSDQSPVC